MTKDRPMEFDSFLRNQRMVWKNKYIVKCALLWFKKKKKVRCVLKRIRRILEKITKINIGTYEGEEGEIIIITSKVI